MYVPKEVMGNIRQQWVKVNVLGVGSGLVPSYCHHYNKYIVCTHAEQDCKIKCYHKVNMLKFKIMLCKFYLHVTLIKK